MSALSVNVQQRFSNLRKKLDQLGYLHPLTVESLPLVESLLTDFVWTTESFRRCKSELERRAEVRERVEEHVEPYKADNGRLASEFNRAQKRLLELRVEHEETVRDLHSQIRQLEQQKYDLVLFNQQCLDKISRYECEAKEMVQKIMVLQEKNFQAVVHTPEGKRKQIPFRRQRMDIDCFIPSSETSSKREDYCCAVSKERSESKTQQSDSYSSDQADLLDAITKKCKELSHQLCRAEDELELSDRKMNNYCDKLKMYEEEISRLSRELSGGRSLEAVSTDGHQRSRDRLIEQLNLQIELLQQRNEELEKEILHLNAINIREGKLSTSKLPTNTRDNDCMLEIQNEKLRHRIEELVDREKCLLKELRASNSKVSQNKSDCIPVIEASLDKEVDNLHKHMKTLEDDRDYWKQEAESHGHEKKSILPRDIDEMCEIKDELAYCKQEIKEIVCQNEELRQMLTMAESGSANGSRNDADRSRNLDSELKRCRAERDSLQDLLDKFERQLHDIQGNIRVLTQERDMLDERYEECQKELHDLRQTIIQSDKSRKDGGVQNSLAAQSILRRLELERDDTMSDLHKMTTERDSLRERLKTLTETALSEKARLSQKLEDGENQKERLCQDREEMAEKLSILRNKIGELEEYNHQLIKKNDSLNGHLEKEKSKLQSMTASNVRFENDLQNKVRRESQLSEELRSSENRLMSLQQRTESQNEELENLKNDSVRLKEILNDVDQEKDQLQSELDAKSEQLRDLEAQLKLKENALDEIRISMTSLEQQLRRIQEVNNHRDKESRALVMHNEQLENDLRHEVSKCDQLKAENCRLEEDLMAISRDQNRLESEYRDAKRCIMELNEEKNQLEQRLMYCQSSESDQHKQNDQLLEQYRELSLDNDKLQLSLQRIEGMNEELSSEVEAREKIVKNMREQLLQAENDIDSLQCNVRHLEDQVSSLRHVLGTNNQVTENHSLEKQEIIQELAAMRDLCARLENSKDNVQRQLSSRLLELEQIKAENSDMIRENDNLREEIESLQESIRSLETVMNAGREKEYMNQMECQERIAELETQNERLVHFESKVQQINRDLSKSNARNSELEAECERLRRQLTSEKFKLELVNQELLRRQKVLPSGFTSDREFINDQDMCDRAEIRPNEVEYYSSLSSSDQHCQITSTGFCSDSSENVISEDSDCTLVCNHGCYHSRDCNKMSEEKKHSGNCGHGCRHSDTCLKRKERMKKDDNLKSSRRRSRELLEILNKSFPDTQNSNNHVVHDKEKMHTNPKCPYNTKNDFSQTTTKNPSEDLVKSSGVQTESNKHFMAEKLPTIISESLDSDKEENSIKSTFLTKEKERYKIVNEKNVQLVAHTLEHLNNNDQHGDATIVKNDDFRIVIPKISVNRRFSATKEMHAETLLPFKKIQIEPLPQLALVLTNDTGLSLISRVTPSTRNIIASSTLAQIPSLTDGIDVEHNTKESTKYNDHNEEDKFKIMSPLVMDEDPTDVSQSLSHSFYDNTDGVQSHTSNSSSGVHTGRSFANHTPTLTDNHVSVGLMSSDNTIPAIMSHSPNNQDEDDPSTL